MTLNNAMFNGINAMFNAIAVTNYCNGIGHAFILHAMALQCKFHCTLHTITTTLVQPVAHMALSSLNSLNSITTATTDTPTYLQLVVNFHSAQ
jgi:hypothetical protein